LGNRHVPRTAIGNTQRADSPTRRKLMILQNGGTMYLEVHTESSRLFFASMIDLVDSQLLSLYDVRSGRSRTQI
jgi:hypothetical protein